VVSRTRRLAGPALARPRPSYVTLRVVHLGPEDACGQPRDKEVSLEFNRACRRRGARTSLSPAPKDALLPRASRFKRPGVGCHH